MDPMATLDVRTGGMHCSSCSLVIEMTVEDLTGVSSVKVDYIKGTTHVVFDPEAVSAADITAAIVHAGYTAEIAA